MRSAGWLALALLVLVTARCGCEPEVEAPPLPIGGGDVIGPPDAGNIYEVDAGPVVCDEDDHEDNDARANATVVSGSAAVAGTYCGEDDDWYAVASSPGCSVLARLTQAAGTGDVDLLLFDPDGQLVGASATVGDTEAINVLASKDGLYAVRVRGGSRDIVDYSLTLTSTCAADLTCPADDTLEDNDAAGEAATLSEGVAHDGILCGADEDWFFAPVTVGCIADARLQLVDDTGDIDLQLLAADGETVVASSSSAGDAERITRVVTGAGMRYRAFLSPAAEQNTYRFVVDEICAGQFACPSDDPFEPNDTRAEARRLFAGLDESIGTICGNDDFYDVIPQPGCALEATLSFVAAQADLDLELLTATGTRLALADGTGDVETIEFAAPNANRLVLRVFGDADNAYRLRVETVCP